MNKHAFLVILLVLAAPLFAFGEQTKEEIKIIAQFEYRDSEGRLVAYFVDFNPFVPDLQQLNEYLDTAPEQLVTKNESSEIITTSGTIKFERDTFSSKTTWGGQKDGTFFTVAVADHDGIPIRDGEILKTTWTFIRTLD